MIKFGAKELRTTVADEDVKKNLKRNPIYIICDNVIDTYNIGSIFRLADAVGATKVFLCGVSETPPNTRIKKASINTTEWVSWEYVIDTKDAIAKLRAEVPNIYIVAVEQDPKSVHFQKAEYHLPLALMVGNETTGTSKDILDLCDQIVEIPMWGVNKSLNVMVSLGIVLFNVASKLLE
ncbi:MAG: TrmH family RNA methyltransferase [Patescibacteria group bacterium]|nr:TrmH family RNA methyltransferase [Patescibacteria group bacterium]